MIPEIDKEVAIKIIEQFPEYTKFSEAFFEKFHSLCNNVIEKANEGTKLAIAAFQQILDELSAELHAEGIEQADKEKIYEQMVDVAKSIADLDRENKRFMDRIVRYYMVFGFGVISLGTVLLGVNIKNQEMPELSP